MVYLFSLRFEDDARALTPRSPKETQGERALFPTEDRRRDHFPVLCCMRAETRVKEGAPAGGTDAEGSSIVEDVHGRQIIEAGLCRLDAFRTWFSQTRCLCLSRG
jgi:hypothetical protein